MNKKSTTTTLSFEVNNIIILLCLLVFLFIINSCGKADSYFKKSEDKSPLDGKKDPVANNSSGSNGGGSGGECPIDVENEHPGEKSENQRKKESCEINGSLKKFISNEDIFYQKDLKVKIPNDFACESSHFIICHKNYSHSINISKFVSVGTKEAAISHLGHGGDSKAEYILKCSVYQKFSYVLFSGTSNGSCLLDCN